MKSAPITTEKNDFMERCDPDYGETLNMILK